MLNGIGGRTIAEAKQRLTYHEALDWFAFIRKRGTLNVGMRLEALFAQQSVLICSAAGIKKQGGGQFSMTDFMPHADEPDELSIEDAMKALGVKADG